MEEALEERILKGVYPVGSALPSVRELARELGTSPSTVSRALQGLERRSWVNVTDRRGASVASTIPRDEGPDERTAEALLSLAFRWRLYGRSAEEFLALVAHVLDDAFRPAPSAFFVECNPVEVAAMSLRVAREVEIRIEPLLLEELRAKPGRVRGGLVLTPFFHLAEVRGMVGDAAEIIPLAVVPSESAMRALAEVPRDAAVVAVGHDERTAQQIAGLASHYALTRAVGVSLTDPARARALIDGADVVVVTNATDMPQALRERARRIVVVEFELEAGGLESVRAAVRSAEAALIE
ncbi:MAG: GntR family transcriptional regulator [Chloroflexi bacterium]|nr:GntR family transcriptional regulator [Chloroflexota bacterium]